MRSSRITVVTISSAIIFFGVAGCGAASSKGDGTSHSTSSDSAQVETVLEGLNRKAEVDPDTAIVTLPVDFVSIGEQTESSVIFRAREAALAKCAREKLNVPWTATAPDPYIPTLHMWTKYGPWTTSVAEKFAFVEPMGDGALIVNGFVPAPEGHEFIPWPNEDISEDSRNQVFEVCNSDPEVIRFDEESLWVNGPGQEALNSEQLEVNRDQRMRELFTELSACYSEYGMEMSPTYPGFITADTQLINEEQITLALQTVECKARINFTQRAADIIAERQIPIIEEHAEELVAAREKWDATVAEAKEYIAQHPELFEKP